MITRNGTHKEGDSYQMCGLSMLGKEFRRAFIVCPKGQHLPSLLGELPTQWDQALGLGSRQMCDLQRRKPNKLLMGGYQGGSP